MQTLTQRPQRLLDSKGPSPPKKVRVGRTKSGCIEQCCSCLAMLSTASTHPCSCSAAARGDVLRAPALCSSAPPGSPRGAQHLFPALSCCPHTATELPSPAGRPCCSLGADLGKPAVLWGLAAAGTAGPRLPPCLGATALEELFPAAPGALLTRPAGAFLWVLLTSGSVLYGARSRYGGGFLAAVGCRLPALTSQVGQAAAGPSLVAAGSSSSPVSPPSAAPPAGFAPGAPRAAAGAPETLSLTLSAFSRAAFSSSSSSSSRDEGVLSARGEDGPADPNPDPPLFLRTPTRSPRCSGRSPQPGRTTPARDRSAHRVHRRVPPPLSAAHLRAAPCGAHAERPGVTAPPGRHRGAPRARTHPHSTSRPRSALRSNSLRRSAPPRSAACSAAANLRGPSRERQPSPPRSAPPRPAPLPGRSPPAAARRQHSASRRPPALLPALPGTAAAAGGSGGGTDCGPPRCAARRDSSGGRGKKRE